MRAIWIPVVGIVLGLVLGAAVLHVTAPRAPLWLILPLALLWTLAAPVAKRLAARRRTTTRRPDDS